MGTNAFRSIAMAIFMAARLVAAPDMGTGAPCDAPDDPRASLPVLRFRSENGSACRMTLVDDAPSGDRGPSTERCLAVTAAACVSSGEKTRNTDTRSDFSFTGVPGPVAARTGAADKARGRVNVHPSFFADRASPARWGIAVVELDAAFCRRHSGYLERLPVCQTSPKVPSPRALPWSRDLGSPLVTIGPGGRPCFAGILSAREPGTGAPESVSYTAPSVTGWVSAWTRTAPKDVSPPAKEAATAGAAATPSLARAASLLKTSGGIR